MVNLHEKVHIEQSSRYGAQKENVVYKLKKANCGLNKVLELALRSSLH